MLEQGVSRRLGSTAQSSIERRRGELHERAAGDEGTQELAVLLNVRVPFGVGENHGEPAQP
jgi:hypothetical protein